MFRPVVVSKREAAFGKAASRLQVSLAHSAQPVRRKGWNGGGGCGSVASWWYLAASGLPGPESSQQACQDRENLMKTLLYEGPGWLGNDRWAVEAGLCPRVATRQRGDGENGFSGGVAQPGPARIGGDRSRGRWRIADHLFGDTFGTVSASP